MVKHFFSLRTVRGGGGGGGLTGGRISNLKKVKFAVFVPFRFFFGGGGGGEESQANKLLISRSNFC